jgi:WD40 repeat protein/DNA-binding SARP family transcriptional activator
MPALFDVRGETRLRFCVLGPLQVWDGDEQVALPGSKEQALLAHLVARAGRTVATDVLMGTLWGDHPPRTATKSLQNHVLRLRKLLEPNRDVAPEVLVTDPGGYRLMVPEEAIDAHAFERLAEMGRRAQREGRPAAASASLREALRLWRGDAYAGLGSTSFAATEARRLEAARRLALEDRIAADLDLGRAADVVVEVEELVAADPLHERSRELLVLALYRAGRQAEALAAIASAREFLRDELGIEPGAGLRTLQAQVLDQDPSLEARRFSSLLPEELMPPPGRFVGRDGELGLLREAWERVITSGAPVTVVVRGMLGSGARRLVGELAAEVADSAVSVCFLRPGTPPDAAVVEGRSRPTLVVVDTRRTPQSWTLPRPTSGPVLTVILAGSSASPDADVVVDLGPLDRRAVAAIIEEYQDEVPTDEMVAEVSRVSAGRPGWVHDEALSLARRRASARLSGSVSRAEQLERDRAAARDDLRAGVVQLRDLSDRGRPADREVCPWKGLGSYTCADADWFAGRERLTAELLTRVAAARFVAVVGGSGSGKSSLLGAGLLGSLAAGALPGSDGWVTIEMRPGSRPTWELARAALRGADPGEADVADLLQRMVFGEQPEPRVVLVVDQMEELWTVCTDAADRKAFLDAITDLIEGPPRSTVVVACRADHVPRLAEHESLGRALADSTLVVGAMSAAELRRSIERPARRAGLLLDDELVDALVDDAEDEPGSLPLLSTALLELWEQSEGRRLTLAQYTATGGLRGAVARLAEGTYATFDDRQMQAVRVLMLRLAGSETGSSVTRRRVTLAELADLPDPQVAAVVEPLVRARMLSVQGEHVEVAHEALYREWPRLRGWLDEHRTLRATQQRLAAAALEWDEGGRERTELWRGSRLAAGLEVAVSAPGQVTTVERVFLAAGEAQAQAEQREAEQQAAAAATQNRRLRGLLAGAVVLLAAAVLAGTLAARAEATAEREARVATARQLAASSLAALDVDPELGVLLALSAVRTTREADGIVLREAREALHQSVNASRVVATYPGVGGLVDWSPDGSVFVTEGPEGTGLVDVRDPDTGESIRAWQGHDIDVNDVIIGEDGTLATAGDDGAVIAWDVASGTEIGRLSGPPGPVWSPSLSADGSLMAAQWANERTVRVGEVRTGRTVLTVGSPDSVGAARLSPDGTRLAAALADESGVRIAVLGVPSGDELVRLDGPPFVRSQATLKWSPDGRWIAAPGDGQLRIWDARSGALRWSVLAQDRYIPGMDWSADSSRVATASHDGTVRVWSLDGGSITELPSLSSLATKDGLVGAAFGPDGDALLAGDLNVEAVTLFDLSLAGTAEWMAARTAADLVTAAFLPGDRAIVASGQDSAAVVLDRASGQVERTLGTGGVAHFIEVSPDGSRVALSAHESVQVVDARSGTQVFSYTPVDEWPREMAWSPDGSLLAVADGEPSTTVVLDMTGAVVGRMREEQGYYPVAVAFSPDGRHVATGRDVTDDQPQLGQWSITIWDWASAEPVLTVDTPAEGLEYSPDGTALATVDVRGPAVVLDAETGDVIARLDGRLGGVQDVDFSPDGRSLATANSDGTLSIWDIATATQSLVLPGHDAPASSVQFSADGRLLASAGFDGVARVWALDLDELLTIAHQRITRELTPRECSQYLPGTSCHRQ